MNMGAFFPFFLLIPRHRVVLDKKYSIPTSSIFIMYERIFAFLGISLQWPMFDLIVLCILYGSFPLIYFVF